MAKIIKVAEPLGANTPNVVMVRLLTKEDFDSLGFPTILYDGKKYFAFFNNQMYYFEP